MRDSYIALDMTLYLIRHGNAYNNLADHVSHFHRYGPDVPLTSLGRRQARRLAKYVRSQSVGADAAHKTATGIHFDRIYTSPMRRTFETAVAVHRAVDVPFELRPDVFELGGLNVPDGSGGRIEGFGYTRADFERRAPQLVVPDSVNGQGWWPGREELREEWPVRADTVIHWLMTEHAPSNRSVCIVSHAGFIGLLLTRIFGLTEARFGMNNTGITRLEIDPDTGAKHLRCHNQLAHLPAGMVS